MNKQGIPVHRANPFDFEKYQREHYRGEGEGSASQERGNESSEQKARDAAARPVVRQGQLPAKGQPVHKFQDDVGNKV